MRTEKLPKNPSPNAPLGRAHWAGLAARLILGGVFLASGFFKLVKPAESFAALIEVYQIIPASMTLPLAKVLPWAELIAGGFLVSGYFISFSAGCLGGLLTLFLIAVGSAMVRGLNLADCGCFGGFGPHLKPWQTLLMDAALLACAVFLTRVRKTPWSIDSWIEKGR